MAVGRAYELGAAVLAIPSAGNAAGAMSAYAAKAGLPAHVYMPEDVPDAFRVECSNLGAEVTLVDGLITDCGAKVREKVEEFGWFDVSTLKEPYRIEGKKTMGYEVVEQLGWRMPDVIIYPTGGGTGLVGMWKAFDEMEQMGLIGSERPAHGQCSEQRLRADGACVRAGRRVCRTVAGREDGGRWPPSPCSGGRFLDSGGSACKRWHRHRGKRRRDAALRQADGATYRCFSLPRRARQRLPVRCGCDSRAGCKGMKLWCCSTPVRG